MGSSLEQLPEELRREIATRLRERLKILKKKKDVIDPFDRRSQE
jgi:hypothetical protein